MKHVVSLSSDEMELLIEVLEMAVFISSVDEEKASDLRYRLDEQLQMDLEEHEPW